MTTSKPQKKKKASSQQPMSEDELRKFVLGVCDGQIFMSVQVKDPNLIPLVFMCLALSEEPLPEGTAIVWEWCSKALPMGVNGLPIFPSLTCMSQETWKRAHAAIMAEQERRANIPV